MTNQLPPAGWYPNPYGEPGQMYWDGQEWRLDTATSTEPADASNPLDQVRPYVDKARPYVDKARPHVDKGLDKGRKLWSELSPESKVNFALRGLRTIIR